MAGTIYVFKPENFARIADVTGYSIDEVARIHAADFQNNQVRYLYVEDFNEMRFVVEEVETFGSKFGAA